VKQRKEENNSNQRRSTKSDLVFLENDDGQETAVHHGYDRYDHYIISEFAIADLLHQDHRRGPDEQCKQSGARSGISEGSGAVELLIPRSAIVRLLSASTRVAIASAPAIWGQRAASAA